MPPRYFRTLGRRERHERLKRKLTVERHDEGILIKADVPQDRLSWEETFKETAREYEGWSGFRNSVFWRRRAANNDETV